MKDPTANLTDSQFLYYFARKSPKMEFVEAWEIRRFRKIAAKLAKREKRPVVKTLIDRTDPPDS